MSQEKGGFTVAQIQALTVPKLKEIIVTNNLHPEKGPKKELVQVVINHYKEMN